MSSPHVLVSDCEAGNQGLWRDLGMYINSKKLYRTARYSWKNIYYLFIYFFADAPHTLKLMRNWFLDTGFLLHDGSIITKDCVHKLINNHNSEVTSWSHKLSPLHINCEKKCNIKTYH